MLVATKLLAMVWGGAKTYASKLTSTSQNPLNVAELSTLMGNPFGSPSSTRNYLLFVSVVAGFLMALGGVPVLVTKTLGPLKLVNGELGYERATIGSS